MTKHHCYHLYILKCSNGTFYTGVTNNLNRRIDEHLNSENPEAYTTRFGPVELVYSTEFKDIEFAIEKEKQIKKWSQQKKKALIDGKYEDLPNLSKKKF